MRRKGYIKQNKLALQAGPRSAEKPGELVTEQATRSRATSGQVVPDPQTSDRVFAYICAYLEQQGYPPSMRNIGRACQLSLGGVVYNLDKLEDRGWLTRTPGVARSLRVRRATSLRPEKSEQTQNICANSLAESVLDWPYDEGKR
jgi:hypothetical protein